MSSKLIHQQKDFFSKMVVDAVQLLDELLPLNMIGIKKVPGGALEVIISIGFATYFWYLMKLELTFLVLTINRTHCSFPELPSRKPFPMPVSRCSLSNTQTLKLLSSISNWNWKPKGITPKFDLKMSRYEVYLHEKSPRIDTNLKRRKKRSLYRIIVCSMGDVWTNEALILMDWFL